MADAIPMDSLEAFQLKECYELAAQFEPLDTARSVLREKSKKLDIPMNYAPVQTDAAYPETEMQIVSEAIYALTLEGFSDFGTDAFPYMHKIESLPDSGEKEFVSALVALRYGTGQTARIYALMHIQAALRFSPNDPRYLALADVLQEAGSR